MLQFLLKLSVVSYQLSVKEGFDLIRDLNPSGGQSTWRERLGGFQYR